MKSQGTGAGNNVITAAPVRVQNSFTTTSTLSTAVTSGTSTRPHLLINYSDEESDVQDILGNKFNSEEKFHKRDSGFHTMTRHQSNENASETLINNGAVVSQHLNIETNKDLNIMTNDELPDKYRGRSSPIITKKSFKFSPTTSDEEADELALKLFKLEGKDKQDVVKHFLNKGSFNATLANKYMGLFNFTNVTLDEAMRLLLKQLALLGETQEREKVLYHFACRYSECNPSFLEGDLNVLHILVCAIALLNTDLHGAKVGGRRRMTRKQFISNLAGVTKLGQDIPTPLLKDLYRSISKHPLPWCEQQSEKPSASINKSPSVHGEKKMKKSQIVIRSQSMNQPSLQKIRPLPVYRDDDGRKVGSCRSSKYKTIPRKQGVLWRKAIVESDGTKTPKRKRRWKLMMAALQGLELHLIKKDSHDAMKVSLHHSLAEVEASHNATKRDNVFRLTLANKHVVLYQVNSGEELKVWVRLINRNAALLSAAPLSAGVGSQIKFQRPLLPSASSTLTLAKQLEEQQDRLDVLCNELDEHQKNVPQDSAKASEKQYYKDKEDYLLHEVHKYEVYTNSLCELVSAERQLNAQEKSSNDPSSCIPETRSLLSISPSEPGMGNNLSSYPSSENTGSVGDLLDHNKPARYRQARDATSFLSPTSSLPNLQPPIEHRHVDPAFHRRGLHSKDASRPDSTPLGLLPVYESDSSLPIPPLPGSPNQNNSNNAPPLQPTLPFPTQRVGSKQGTISKQSSFVGTSYLSKDVANEKPVSPLIATTLLSGPSRIKGRNERKGSSRYSYMHAVQDTAQI